MATQLRRNGWRAGRLLAVLGSAAIRTQLAGKRQLDLPRRTLVPTSSGRPLNRSGACVSVSAALAAAALAGLAIATSAAGSGSAVTHAASLNDVRARAIVRRFFETINAREFATTCDLLSVRFYRRNHVPDKRHCVLGLTAGLTMSPTVFFRIITVHSEGEQTVVRAAANGAAGKIVLVNERGGLKILSVGS